MAKHDDVPESAPDPVAKPLPDTTADGLLRVLVDIVNRSDALIFHITLSIGGLMIAGELVGGREYFDAMAENFAHILPDDDGPNSEANRQVKDVFIEMGTALYGPEVLGKTGVGKPPAQYIHIKNAHYWLPTGGPVPSDGSSVWWRGRLSAVDGFTLGAMSFVM